MAQELPTALARLPHSNAAEPEPEIDELVQIALDVAGSLEPRQVIVRILERAVRALQADRATLSSLGHNAICIEATTGLAGSVTWIGQEYSADYFEGQPLIKRALASLRPAFGGRLTLDTAAPEFRAALADVKHVVALPLVHGGQATGLLVLSRYEDRPFSEDDMPALTLIGAISGLALRNARLYEEVQEARTRADTTAARLRVAVEAAEEVASQTALDALLTKLLQGACAAVDADGASLARLDGNELVIESTITGGGVGTRWPIAPKVLAGIRTGRPVQLTAEEYTGTPPGLESMVQPYRRFLVAPLLGGGETIGLVAIGRRDDRPFEQAGIQSLQQFTALGALLLRNARLMARAQEAERAKSEFMSFAVHQLRGPLTVASGYLSMALEGGFGEVPGAAKDALQIAQRKTEEAKQLADELLTVARMEEGALKPGRERFSVSTAVREAAARARPRADLLHGRVTVESAGDIEAIGDPALLAKVLDNLFNNALSYVEGAPTVQIQASRTADRAVIQISDNGIGISADDRQRIFRRFSRGTDHRVLDKSGTGLGLYLSRGLAEQMGGSLSLEQSEPGSGSTFALRLPLAPARG
jgi:signal transduction histidine kinase